MLKYQYIEPKHSEIIQGFQCPDEPSVAEFLKEHALNLHQLRSAVTRLYFDENQNLVGYFTLHNDLVHVFSNQRKKHEWKLPMNIDHFPAIKIHYLGVDKRYRGLGYGRYLLSEAVHVVQELAGKSGCNFITVEALFNAIGFYEKFGFVIRQKGKSYQPFHNMVLKLDELWT